MVHPLLTTVFDLFLVGTAGVVVSAMAHEYLASRVPSVGSSRKSVSTRRATRPVRKTNVGFASQRAHSRRIAA